MKWILRSLGWIYIAGMMVSVLAIALRPVVSAVSVRKLFVILCGTVFLTPVTAIVAVWCSSTLSRSEKWVRTREFTIGFRAFTDSVSYLISGGRARAVPRGKGRRKQEAVDGATRP
jgi:hypothetical protein